MRCLSDGRFLKALVFQHVVVLLLTHSCGGQSQVAGPPPRVVALLGADVLLPCHLDPAADAVSMILEWARPDLKPRFVHVWHEGQDLLENQNPSYRGRTSLSVDKLKHGDLSLKLSKVRVSDSGTYRCFVPKLSRESAVQLTVGAASSPVIAGINMSSNAGVLQCESAGWYPEPEVVWLDGEGNLLPAGPTETVRGPDDLYTVSSRVTVEKRHSNSFTCRVQQKSINQTRETHFQITGFIISDKCSMASSGSAARISITLAAVFISTLAVMVIMWIMWQQNKTKIQMDESEQTGQKQQLMSNSRGEKESEEKKTEADERPQKKDFVLVVNALKEQKEKLEALRDKLNHQKDDMEREKKETDEKVQLVEEETGQERGTGYMRLKELIFQNKKKVMERKDDQEQLILNTEKLLFRAEHVLREIKTDVEPQRENHRVTGGGEETAS